MSFYTRIELARHCGIDLTPLGCTSRSESLKHKILYQTCTYSTYPYTYKIIVHQTTQQYQMLNTAPLCRKQQSSFSNTTLTKLFELPYRMNNVYLQECQRCLRSLMYGSCLPRLSDLISYRIAMDRYRIANCFVVIVKHIYSCYNKLQSFEEVIKNWDCCCLYIMFNVSFC